MSMSEQHRVSMRIFLIKKELSQIDERIEELHEELKELKSLCPHLGKKIKYDSSVFCSICNSIIGNVVYYE